LGLSLLFCTTTKKTACERSLQTERFSDLFAVLLELVAIDHVLVALRIDRLRMEEDGGLCLGRSIVLDVHQFDYIVLQVHSFSGGNVRNDTSVFDRNSRPPSQPSQHPPSSSPPFAELSGSPLSFTLNASHTYGGEPMTIGGGLDQANPVLVVVLVLQLAQQIAEDLLCDGVV
jgi:hypothetical protein